jgi:hypothetical protein
VIGTENANKNRVREAEWRKVGARDKSKEEKGGVFS